MAATKQGIPPEKAWTYDFGSAGVLDLALTVGEISPIEERLRQEYPTVFERGYCFLRNCDRDTEPLREVFIDIADRNLDLECTARFTTFDSALRVLSRGYALFARARRTGHVEASRMTA